MHVCIVLVYQRHVFAVEINTVLFLSCDMPLVHYIDKMICTLYQVVQKST